MTTDPRLSPSTPITLIHESVFSDYVTELYGRPYQYQQQGNMHAQETIEKFTVPCLEDHLLDWDGQTLPTLAEWQAATPPDPEDRTRTGFNERLRWERDYHPFLGEIINDLHTRGLLDPGNYALHIWW